MFDKNSEEPEGQDTFFQEALSQKSIISNTLSLGQQDCQDHSFIKNDENPKNSGLSIKQDDEASTPKKNSLEVEFLDNKANDNTEVSLDGQLIFKFYLILLTQITLITTMVSSNLLSTKLSMIPILRKNRHFWYVSIALLQSTYYLLNKRNLKNIRGSIVNAMLLIFFTISLGMFITGLSEYISIVKLRIACGLVNGMLGGTALYAFLVRSRQFLGYMGFFAGGLGVIVIGFFFMFVNQRNQNLQTFTYEAGGYVSLFSVYIIFVINNGKSAIDSQQKSNTEIYQTATAIYYKWYEMICDIIRFCLKFGCAFNANKLQT